ncbi:MMPL family transporter [Streptomyces sp. x-19]|uniref:MMPL family transporter n=1 Tax=Streptomyces sp. x-19 TaxID=2789280 RepID=UPI00397E943F
MATCSPNGDVAPAPSPEPGSDWRWPPCAAPSRSPQRPSDFWRPSYCPSSTPHSASATNEGCPPTPPWHKPRAPCTPPSPIWARRSTWSSQAGTAPLNRAAQTARSHWTPTPGACHSCPACRQCAQPPVDTSTVQTATPACHPPVTTPAAAPSGCPLFQRYRSQSAVWLSITTQSDTYAPSAADLVRRIRALPAPVRPLIGGPTAEFLDTQTIVSQPMPAARILATAATFLLLLAYTRSLFLPLKALCLNLLSLTATFGAMVLIFQEGHLRWRVRFVAHRLDGLAGEPGARPPSILLGQPLAAGDAGGVAGCRDRAGRTGARRGDDRTLRRRADRRAMGRGHGGRPSRGAGFPLDRVAVAHRGVLPG